MISDRYRSLPRAARWATWALLAFALYFAAVEPAIDATNRLSGQADAYQARLASYHGQAGDRKRHLETIALGSRRHGQVLLPGSSAERSEQLNAAVARILSERGVSQYTASTLSARALNRGPLVDAMGGPRSIDRLIKQLRFSSTPETVARIIADLERAPEVAAVTSVQIRRTDAQTVEATVLAEAWLRVRGGADSGAPVSGIGAVVGAAP